MLSIGLLLIGISLVINYSSSPVILYVTDPNNRTVHLSKNQSDFFTFKPEIAGKFTLYIVNNRLNPVTLNGIFGYVPMTITNNVNLLNGIFVGSSIVVSGIITLIIGIIFLILNRSRQRRPLTP